MISVLNTFSMLHYTDFPQMDDEISPNDNTLKYHFKKYNNIIYLSQKKTIDEKYLPYKG